MDDTPQHIRVAFDKDGRPRLDGKFPFVALVDPDIPVRFNSLARYVDDSARMMRVTVGDWWAIYHLDGVTLAGAQTWRLLAVRHLPDRDVNFIARYAYDSEERKQIEAWLSGPTTTS
jgi:hypothetical protein